MADTTLIKERIEPYVRNWLSTKFPSHTFEKRRVQLVSGYWYEFDAVSEDYSIVAAVLCNRPKTRTGRENTGGVRKALDDVFWLKSLPVGIKSVMVFTDAGFCDLARRRTSRLGTEQVQMIVCNLPVELNEELRRVLDEASKEQRAAE